MKKFNKLLNYAPGGGLSKAVQRKLDKEDYSVNSLKEFSQIVTMFQTFRKYHLIRSLKVFTEDTLLMEILLKCDYNAMWDNKEIIKQIVTRIKFLRENVVYETKY